MEENQARKQIKDCTVCGMMKEDMAMIWNSYICEPCEEEVGKSNVLEN